MNTQKFNARVWEVKKVKGSNIVTANVSTYEGEDKDGKPIYSSWSGRFVGDAYKPATKLEDGERIGISSAKVTTYYDKKKEKTYANLTIFDFEEPFDFKEK